MHMNFSNNMSTKASAIEMAVMKSTSDKTGVTLLYGNIYRLVSTVSPGAGGALCACV